VTFRPAFLISWFSNLLYLFKLKPKPADDRYKQPDSASLSRSVVCSRQYQAGLVP